MEVTEALSIFDNLLESEDQLDNTSQDVNELNELQKLIVWGQHQEVLEKQALEELEIFAKENSALQNVNTLEDGEIFDNHEESSQAVANTTLDINSYIKRQQEFKKRQDYKRSLQVDALKSKVDKIAAKRNNDVITKNLLKRKLQSETTIKPKRKKAAKHDVLDIKDASSGSEYVPSDDSDYESEVKMKKKSSKQNSIQHIDKVRDDGCFELYNSRLKEYYKKLESNPEELLLEDIELRDGLKVPQKLWDNLYSYQQKGLKWLWNIHQEQVGGLLGDEMGLGKTVQVIAFLAAIEHSKIVSKHGFFTGLGPTLIVAPATVIHQWVQHFQEWAPEFRVAVLHQSGSFNGNKFKLIREINKCKGILITTYSGILKYAGNLCELQWHFTILDEGHKIRNPGAKVSIAVKKLQTLYRIMLTGSPMQNNLQELWSLFDFIVPGMLGTLQIFMEHFANPIMQGGFANASAMQETTARSVASALKEIISPHLLRRTKNEVKSHISLPNKSEQVLFCSLTDEQRNLYKDFLMSEQVNSILGRGIKNSFSQNYARSNVLVAITALRKICNHPDLYFGEQDSNKDEAETSVEDKFGYYKRSGKMVVVSALLKIWKKQKHRVLLFTQSRGVLDMFEEFFRQQDYKYLKMDGTTNIGSRQPLIDKFNRDASYDVFLLTTRVGGLGVNLTGANRVIIFDPDWNPATDTQARERAWRIGQQKDVTVYRLISAGTIEEKMYQRQVWKQLLSNKVLLDPKTQRFFKTSDLYDLFSLQESTNGSNPETANIFRNSRVNLQEQIDKKKQLTETELPKVQFSNEKIEAMKTLAQKLSKNITEKANLDNSRQNKSCHQKELEKERAEKLQERESLKILTPIELRNLNRTKLNVTEVSSNKMDDNKTNICFTEALEMSENTSKLYRSAKGKKVKNANYVKTPASSTISVMEDSKQNCVNVDTSGKVDGEVVEGLVKIEKKKKENRRDSDSGETQDLYILEKLFSKKGVQTALEHDVIVQSGYKNENSIKLDYEAQQKTDTALKALKKSRADNWNW